MKRHTQNLIYWIFALCSVFFLLLGVASTPHAALYTVSDTTTSSLGDGFQIPTFGTVLNCDGDCGLGGDAVLVSFYFRDVAPQYDQSILQVRTSSGLQRPLGAGYMAGTDISPTIVNILDESNMLGGVFDFSSPFLNPGDATNSLLLTYQAGSLIGGDLQWRYRKTDDNSLTPFATSSLTELQAVPIPGAIWLFGSAFIGFAAIKRKLSK
jgi:hypothetical protein